MTEKVKKAAAAAEAIYRILGDDPEMGVWADGFLNVLRHGQNASDDDNPYTREEMPAYEQYRRGAMAAVSLITEVRIRKLRKKPTWIFHHKVAE